MKIKLLSILTIVLSLTFTTHASAQQNCPTLPTNTGSVTTSVNILSAGNYKVWSRLQGANELSNAYYLQIDNGCAMVVGDSEDSLTSTWEWVDYQNGNASSPITLSLTAGNHIVRMIGKESNVKLDKVLFASDLTCIPVNTGTNCGPVPTATTAPTAKPTTKPTVAENQPSPTTPPTASGDLSVTTFTLINAETDKPITGYENIPAGSVTLDLSTLPTNKLNFRANTSPSKVGSVRFTYDGSVRNTESGSAPYAFAGDNNSNYSVWTPSVGTHVITATPYSLSDVKGTKGTVFTLNVTVKTDSGQGTVKDIEPPTVSILSPVHNIKVTAGVALTLAAAATDDKAVTKVDFSVTGGTTPFSCSDSTPSYSCIWNVPSSSGTYTITAKSYDAAGNTPGIQVIQVRAE